MPAACLRAATAGEGKAAVTLSYATITVPISGVISRSQADVGGLVEAGSALLATVYRTDPIRAEFCITDQEFSRFRQANTGKHYAPRSIVFRLEFGDDTFPSPHIGRIEMPRWWTAGPTRLGAGGVFPTLMPCCGRECMCMSLSALGNARH